MASDSEVRQEQYWCQEEYALTVLLCAVFFNPLPYQRVVGRRPRPAGNPQRPLQRLPRRGLARLLAQVAQDFICQSHALFHRPRSNLGEDRINVRAVNHMWILALHSFRCQYKTRRTMIKDASDVHVVQLRASGDTARNPAG